MGISGQTAHAAKLYEEICASCHDREGSGAPMRAALEQMTIEQIKASLIDGVMKQQGAQLGRFDILVLAEYLGRETPEVTEVGPMCEGQLATQEAPLWGSWGAGPTNTRFQSASAAGLAIEDVESLELAWAFGFPGAQRARSQPAVTRQAIFTGSQSGLVYALDPQRGCV